MVKTISIPEWHRMGEEGNAPPVRIRLSGNSMYPLIRRNRDYVTVMPSEKLPEAGDIVLFTDPGRGRYVMHRVWAVRDGRILTWGDNCRDPDWWMPAENILGKTILIERGKRTIHPDPKKGMLLAGFWHRAGKAYRFVRRIRCRAARRIRQSGLRQQLG